MITATIITKPTTIIIIITIITIIPTIVLPVTSSTKSRRPLPSSFFLLRPWLPRRPGRSVVGGICLACWSFEHWLSPCLFVYFIGISPCGVYLPQSLHVFALRKLWGKECICMGFMNDGFSMLRQRGS